MIHLSRCRIPIDPPIATNSRDFVFGPLPVPDRPASSGRLMLPALEDDHLPRSKAEASDFRTSHELHSMTPDPGLGWFGFPGTCPESRHRLGAIVDLALLVSGVGMTSRVGAMPAIPKGTLLQERWNRVGSRVLPPAPSRQAARNRGVFVSGAFARDIVRPSTAGCMVKASRRHGVRPGWSRDTIPSHPPALAAGPVKALAALPAFRFPSAG